METYRPLVPKLLDPRLISRVLPAFASSVVARLCQILADSTLLWKGTYKRINGPLVIIEMTFSLGIFFKSNNPLLSQCGLQSSFGHHSYTAITYTAVQTQVCLGRTSHMPNLMLMSKFYCSTSFVLAHVKFDV